MPALPGFLGVNTMLRRYTVMEPSIKPAASSKASPHFSVQGWFEQVFGERPGGLKPSVELLGLARVGTNHRGIDDAKNVAAVVLYLLGQRAV